ncbi:MAG: succinylglutamate desuccinylase/aspartoacylase family protein [Planctomycetota bacterium]|jgi:succinylglutamate desuccinylase
MGDQSFPAPQDPDFGGPDFGGSGPTMAPRLKRELGRHIGSLPGPTLVICGGLHGNEPAGALAAQRVSAALDHLSLPLRGEWLAVAGNLSALRHDRRYHTVDLNRCWTEPELRAMLARDPATDSTDQAEQRELVDAFGAAAERARGPLVLLDLHTTSGESPPFLVLSDSLRNRNVAAGLPGTVILGLEESVDGTLLDYISNLGHCALVAESASHRSAAAVALHESYIWASMASCGQLDRADVPGYADHMRRLKEASRDAPRVVEIRYRHDIKPDDRFVMQPGFRSFQRVEEGEVLAHDRDGPVRAPRGGLLLMPLYQEQGDEGFFIVKPVRPIWLKVSRIVRTLRLGRLLPLLPGVRRDPDRPDGLRVNIRVARFYTAEIFHLFGYRRRRREGEQLLFTRRR